MSQPRFLAVAALAAACAATHATASDYDVFIVACNAESCARIADETLVGGGRTEYRRGELRLAIEPLAVRADETDAKVSLDVAPRSGRPVQRVQMLVEPCTLRRGAFQPLASFSADGTAYRLWARLAAVR